MFYAGVGLALVLVVTTVQAVQVLSATTQELLDEWRSAVEHSAQHLQVQVDKDELLVDRLAAELASTEPVPSGPAPAAMRSTFPRLGVFRAGLFWVTPQGVMAASVPETVAPDAFLPAVLSDSLPAPGAARRLSSLLRTRSGLPVVTLAVPMGRRGTLVAVADLQSGVLDDYLPFPSADGHAALIDPKGWVLASNETDLRFTQGEHPQWVADVRRQGRSTVGETNGAGGHQPHVMAFAPVGSTGWSLVFGEPASEALAARIRLIHGALLLGLLADIVVLIYAWWETGSLTGALRKLTAVTERITGGDLDVPVDVRRQDEIGALSRAFDTMRQRLNESRQELAQALTESQRRAQETTALYAVSRAILHPTGQEGALRTIVDRARELLGGTAASLSLADTADSPMRVVAASGPLADGDEPGGEPVGGGEPAVVPVAGPAPGRLRVTPGPDHEVTAQDRRLLAGLADLAALAAAQERFQDQSRRLVLYTERERIARDLHDTVSQSLSYLYSQLELLQELLPKLSTDQLRAELRSLSDVASVAFESARDSIYSLRAESSGQEPLPSAIAGCVRNFTARTGIGVDLNTDAAAHAPLAAETEAQLVRVVQEALANVAKHAGATRVAVTAEAQDDGYLRVTVNDNGIGFDPQAPRPGHRSFGLEMMRERVASVGGILNIQSTRGHGTRVEVRVPVQPPGGSTGA